MLRRRLVEWLICVDDECHKAAAMGWDHRDDFIGHARPFSFSLCLASVVLASMVYDGKVCRKGYPMV